MELKYQVTCTPQFCAEIAAEQEVAKFEGVLNSRIHATRLNTQGLSLKVPCYRRQPFDHH